MTISNQLAQLSPMNGPSIPQQTSKTPSSSTSRKDWDSLIYWSRQIGAASEFLSVDCEAEGRKVADPMAVRNNLVHALRMFLCEQVGRNWPSKAGYWLMYDHARHDWTLCEAVLVGQTYFVTFCGNEETFTEEEKDSHGSYHFYGPIRFLTEPIRHAEVGNPCGAVPQTPQNDKTNENTKTHE